MDGNVTGQRMQHFVLRKLVLFTVLLTEEAYFLRKMKELRKQRLSHHHRHWSCDTGLTHRLYELKLLPLLDLLDEADILQRGPREVPLLHLQGGVSLKKGKHKQKRFNMYKTNLYKFNGTKSFLTSSWWQLSRHSPIQISLILCATGLCSRHCFVFMADSGLSLRQDHWAAEARLQVLLTTRCLAPSPQPPQCLLTPGTPEWGVRRWRGTCCHSAT